MITGIELSTHTEGCGGANGEIQDNKAISENPAIISATNALIGLEGVAEHLEVSYDDDAAEIVATRAEETAQLESEYGWDGQQYVEEVTRNEPDNVDKLWSDPQYEKYKGHAEDAVVVIVGKKTLRDGIFVWNIDASKRVIDGLVANGSANRQQATIAELAKHLAVADRLPSNKTPLIVLSAA